MRIESISFSPAVLLMLFIRITSLCTVVEGFSPMQFRPNCHVSKFDARSIALSTEFANFMKSTSFSNFGTKMRHSLWALCLSMHAL